MGCFNYEGGGGRRVDPETAKLERDLHANVLKRQAAFDAAQAKDEPREKERDLGGLLGGCELTKEKVKQILESDRRIYYRTHELNDKLYLHYGGYRKFENLEGFTGLKTLYAECNALESLEGLENCTALRSLFLQENCFKSMEGVGRFTEVWSLNMSSNFLERIDDVRKLPNLNTLMIPKNRIGFNGVEDLIELVGSKISCLDIQDNKIDDPEILPEVLMRMPNLSCLYLKGNPVCKKIPNYRKTVIASLRGLKYLDDRPVFVEDRRYAEAFNRGGIAEEREERKRFKAEKDEQHRRNMDAFRNMVENAKREKQERRAMRMEDKYTDETDPVEDPDRRTARLKKEWEEKNADKLKDDAKEHAEKCLKAEREAQKKKTEGQGEMPADKLPFSTEKDEDGEDEPPPLELVDPEAPNALKKMEDKRTLVYDDIWDDVPAGSTSSASAPAPHAASKNSEDLLEQIWEQGEAALKARGLAGEQELKELKKLKEAAKKNQLSEALEAPVGMRASKAADPSPGASAPDSEAGQERPSAEKATRMAIQGDDDDEEEEDEKDVAGMPAAPVLVSAERPVFAPPPRRPNATAAAAPLPLEEDNELDEMD